MKRIVLVSLTAAFLVGCQDGRFPTGAEPGSPLMEIFDGRDGDNPNGDFFWLPPIDDDPVNDPNFEADNFDPNLLSLLRVRICAKGDFNTDIIDGTCTSGLPVAEFTSITGLGGETIKLEPDHYHVNWHTDLVTMDDATDPRIFFLVNEVVVGFGDVDVVNGGKDLKNVNGDDIALKDGKTLPIKGRLEAGIGCFVFFGLPSGTDCAAGAVDLTVGGTVPLDVGPTTTGIDVPGGGADENVVFVIRTCAEATAFDDLPIDIPTFGPCIDVTAFDSNGDPVAGVGQPTTVFACVDVGSLNVNDNLSIGDLTNLQAELIRVHRFDGPTNVTALPLAGDCTTLLSADLGSNTFMRFARAVRDRLIDFVAPRPLHARRRRIDFLSGGLTPNFSQFQFALPAKMVKVAGTDTQDVLVGEAVANDPAVFVTDAQGNAVKGATVTFAADANSTVAPTTAVSTGGDGIAAVDSWTLTALGTSELEATGFGIGDVAVFAPDPPETGAEVALAEGTLTFTATGFAEVVLDFEGLADRAAVTNQFAGLGVTFTGAEILTKGGSLNLLFPPKSGDKVIFDFPEDFNGLITVSFTVQVFRAGGFVTGNRVITLSCFDASNVLLGSISTAAANFVGADTGVDPNVFLEVSSAGIAKCTFEDDGNTYTVDDFTFAHTGS